ncbi:MULTISPECIES: hypothetical protein [unclassified Exiguobacterium]|uniref:hypothetical protein n=1 Tax=unclassified Exiguobacterium TaxID=2644629 RepID=UPI001BE7851D|nr:MULTISPECIES: hypothetical protein [unclassified Exiguobacterium]
MNKKVAELNKTLKQAETKKIQDETVLKTLRSQYTQVKNEMKEMGVEPDKAEDEIKKMDEEIEKLLLEAEACLPDLSQLN